MNAKKWREKGFKTLFRHDQGEPSIYLVAPTPNPDGSLNIYRRPIHNGDWMLYDELNRFLHVTSLPPENIRNVEVTLQQCYCNQLGSGNCDFCTGMRAGDAPDWTPQIPLKHTLM